MTEFEQMWIKILYLAMNKTYIRQDTVTSLKTFYTYSNNIEPSNELNNQNWAYNFQ